MTTRAEVDAVIAGKLETRTGGPVSRADITAVFDSVLDYIDGAVVSNVGEAPEVTGLSCEVVRIGPMATMTFTLDAVEITHTDAAASGSSGSLKIFDFAEGFVQPIAANFNLTFTGDNLIDGDAGDLSFVYGLGSAAANAGDGALTSTEVDFAAVSSAVTLSSYTATSERATGAGTAVNGTGTAADLYFNTSGTAATSEANGVLTVAGTITVIVLFGPDN